MLLKVRKLIIYRPAGFSRCCFSGCLAIMAGRQLIKQGMVVLLNFWVPVRDYSVDCVKSYKSKQHKKSFQIN